MNHQGKPVNNTLWTNLKTSRRSSLIFIAFFCYSVVATASDVPKERWEYRFYLPVATVCDNSNNSLVDGLNKLGAEGWEVISFTPAGGESRATMVGRDQNNSQ